MWPKNFRKRLILTIAVLVIFSGLIISQIVTHRYSTTLFQVAVAQGENIAHNLALDAADKILINDLVSLQNLLDDRVRSNPKIAYLFVVRDNRILTHTFPKGVPVELINANVPEDNHQGHLKKIISNTKDRYMDFAWPIFEGKSGVLRLGLSEKPFRSQISQLWLQMSVITFVVLLLVLLVAHLLVKHITRPLVQLTEQVEKIDEGHMDVNLEINDHDEIGRLGASFKQMLTRIQNYTLRITEYANSLEEKNRQLNRAHRQTRISFEIAKEVGALPNLKAVCEFLVKKLQNVVKCQNMVFVFFSSKKSAMFAYSEKNILTIEGNTVDRMATSLSEVKQIEIFDSRQIFFKFNELASAKKIMAYPVRLEKRLLGALYIGCHGECDCAVNELDIIDLVMNQTAGAILRAALYEDEIGDLKQKVDRTGFFGMIGKDPRMQVVYKLIEDVASSDATVLIQGESGTGKEMVAHAIHQESHRKNKPFIVINCSAYPATLLESELFGHERGAFTGALKTKPGRFEQADGGTVFLDEIGEIPSSAQIKLLRILQSRKFERLGGRESLSVDVRILAATNKNLLEEVKDGRFREDLFYRLNVIPIHLPLLRDRRNDLLLLTRHFLDRFANVQNKAVKDFSTEVMRRLMDYSWPGNVRELENTIEHAVVLAKGEQIQVSDLPSHFLNTKTPPVSDKAVSLEETEKQHLFEVLEKCQWNKKKAAEILGIGRSTLYVKLKKYQLKSPTYH
ncbi:MAG: sigma 54-interacting transcriptional regulator [Deltaproteobacteria bacterium]|nr:sigma 54-interacting transcriptional regulator [Deltaproteobacteria bacterium]MBW2619853.1 sigma 54-interacting transcriptional regulator [Deltaproteobacteria bacterium]MBW2641880.1 sigma 54-interacting transcriptional regulator [Deltaproteobacteria bacterium]